MLHPLFSLFLMLLGFLGAFVTTALAIVIGSWAEAWAWSIYAIPFVGVGTIGLIVSRNRKGEVAEHDDKDFRNSAKALDWFVEEVKKEE